MKKILHLFLLGAALASGASDGEFAPYQTIIDRMPFGRPPAAYAQAEDADDTDESDALDETDPAYEKAAARRTVLSREGVSVELALGAVVQAPGKTAKPAK